MTQASAPAEKPLVELNEVNKYYGTNHVLKNINLAVNKGEVIILLGPSGSGKSTLCRTINRLETTSSGSIHIDGKELPKEGRELAKLRAEVGMVFQSFNLFAHKTILDNVTLGPRRIRKLSKEQAEAEAMELLAKVGVDSQAEKMPAQLSGGQQQRVAIARALLVDAPVLILDEATAFTDPESEAEIQKALTTLVRGRTVLVIAHRPESILGVDQIAVLDHGNLVACGAPNDVIDHPLFTGLARISSGHNTEDLS